MSADSTWLWETTLATGRLTADAAQLVADQTAAAQRFQHLVDDMGVRMDRIAAEHPDLAETVASMKECTAALGRSAAALPQITHGLHAWLVGAGEVLDETHVANLHGDCTALEDIAAVEAGEAADRGAVIEAIVDRADAAHAARIAAARARIRGD
ncbi:hypothetical protein EB73_27865 [Mycobacterium sp. SWH-M3]|nr:hypothetical protein EB73_27865 [Mycobacterium sp. SWH-M3]